ncbi:MAG: inositol monophosphatase, partial [Planctomycetes bacterium]|nr:inositol monophosphatase [Planctomycetota bacterium]
MVDPAWLRLRAVACAAANAGGRAALARFHDRERLAVESKSDESPVTIADREAEDACQATIMAAYPDDAWLGEESGGRGETGAVGTRRWIVDPIDGTRAYLSGHPDWSIAIALLVEGRPVLGLVYAPAHDLLYEAAAGTGALRNGAPIATSDHATLRGARVAGPKPLIDRLDRAAGATERLER